MSSYCALFRLRLAAQMQSRRIWGSALLICLVFTFIFAHAVVLCFWIASFLLFIYSCTSADQYLLVQLPIDRRRIIRAHFCYYLLLNTLLGVIFWIMSSVNPWHLGAGLPDTKSLVFLFSLSLLYTGLGYVFYYRGWKYTQLFYIAGYLAVLGLINFGDIPFITATSPLLIFGFFLISLLAYGGLCRLTESCFAQKDLL